MRDRLIQTERPTAALAQPGEATEMFMRTGEPPATSEDRLQSAALAGEALSEEDDLVSLEAFESAFDAGFDSDLDSLLVSLEVPLDPEDFSEVSDALFLPLFA